MFFFVIYQMGLQKIPCRVMIFATWNIALVYFLINMILNMIEAFAFSDEFQIAERAFKLLGAFLDGLYKLPKCFSLSDFTLIFMERK